MRDLVISVGYVMGYGDFLFQARWELVACGEWVFDGKCGHEVVV
jgi:hypothetical protein